MKQVYSVKPKFQVELMNRSRYVKYITLNIGCTCVGNRHCVISRWEVKCSNKFPYYDCGGQCENDDKNNNIIVPATTIKNMKLRRDQRKNKYISRGKPN